MSSPEQLKKKVLKSTSYENISYSSLILRILHIFEAHMIGIRIRLCLTTMQFFNFKCTLALSTWS